MATPAISDDIKISSGAANQLDAVIRVMEGAFGDQFGEAWTRSQLSGILPMTGVVLNVAIQGSKDEIIGFSLFRTVAEEAELLLLAVLPNNQRHGVGTVLLDNFLDNAQREGVNRVHLEVRDGNPAVGLYRAAGFSPVGRRRNYYHGQDGHQYDAITLAREV